MVAGSDDEVEGYISGVVGFVVSKSDRVRMCTSGLNVWTDVGLVEARVPVGVAMMNQVVCGQF